MGLLAAGLGASCQPSQPGQSGEQATAVATEPAQSATPASKPSEQEPLTVQRTRQLMGTIVQITVLATPGQSRAALERAVQEAFQEIVRLEGLLSEWQPDSEISRINRAAGQHAVPVSEDTWHVIEAGLQVSRWSEGAFDLTWAALRGLYSFQPDAHRVPEPSELAARLPLIDYRAVQLDPSARTVRLPKAGMAIGTGSIAKGYALDRAGEVLQKAGIAHYMIFGGGQIQVFGGRLGRPFRVGIQHPRRNDYFAYLEVDTGSVATSGDYEHAFMQGGVHWHHLLDLATGFPVRHTMSVTVLSDSGLYADALSTAIFAMGKERALSRLATVPGRSKFVLVDKANVVHVGGELAGALFFNEPMTGPGPLKPRD